MPNHFTGHTVYDVLPENEAKVLEKRAVVAKKLTPVKVEAIVRGYLAGSGWKDYQKDWFCLRYSNCLKVCRKRNKLPEVIFTPSTKAAVGDHDENISFEECERIIGKELAAEVRARRFSFTRKQPNMPNPAVLLFAIPSLNLVWMKKVL